MIFTEKDYIEMASRITEGEGCIDIERNDELLVFDYNLIVDGYNERETNAIIITDVELQVENICCVNEFGDEVPNDFDENRLVDMVCEDYRINVVV